jgi:hypothetical protein
MSARFFALFGFTLFAAACDSLTGPDPCAVGSQPSDACAPPDVTGEWVVALPRMTAVGLTMDMGSCQFDPITIQLLKSDEAALGQAYSGTHSEITANCDLNVLQTIGLSSNPVPILSGGALQGEVAWSTICQRGGPLNDCTWVRDGLLDIRLVLGGACPQLAPLDDPPPFPPLADGPVRAPPYCSGAVRLIGQNRPDDGTLSGGSVYDFGYHDGNQFRLWTARRR